MKVIGKADGSQLICIVDPGELEKFLGLYYGKMPPIKVGDTIDLAAGFNYANQISDAMKATQELITKNKSVVEAILNGMSITARIDKT
jgi:hypothetical protein